VILVIILEHGRLNDVDDLVVLSFDVGLRILIVTISNEDLGAPVHLAILKFKDPQK
jgi:hypothetical protein